MSISQKELLKQRINKALEAKKLVGQAQEIARSVGVHIDGPGSSACSIIDEFLETQYLQLGKIAAQE